MLPWRHCGLRVLLLPARSTTPLIIRPTACALPALHDSVIYQTKTSDLKYWILGTCFLHYSKTATKISFEPSYRKFKLSCVRLFLCQTTVFGKAHHCPTVTDVLGRSPLFPYNFYVNRKPHRTTNWTSCRIPYAVYL